VHTAADECKAKEVNFDVDPKTGFGKQYPRRIDVGDLETREQGVLREGSAVSRENQRGRKLDRGRLESQERSGVNGRDGC